MRSRTGSLPCSRWRWRYLGPPPWRASARCGGRDRRRGPACGRGWLANAASAVSIRDSRTSPPAAVRLEAAGRAAPDRVHAIHLLAAALAEHLVVAGRRDFQRGNRAHRRFRRLGLRHAGDYLTAVQSRPAAAPAIMCRDGPHDGPPGGARPGRAAGGGDCHHRRPGRADRSRRVLPQRQHDVRGVDRVLTRCCRCSRSS